MSATDSFEGSILDLILKATAIANMADNAASAPATNLYISLHTADPGEAGTQTTSEIAYTSYARVAVARSGSGWSGSGGGSRTNAADITFPACTGGSGTATHFGIGLSSSGAGTLLLSGTLTPNLAISNGITPKIPTGQLTVTAD